MPSSKAEISRPLASYGVAGATTLIPATAVNHDSTFCEWKGPGARAAADGARITTGTRAAPAPVGLGQVVDDLVEAAGDEVAELHLDHGDVAAEGEAERAPDRRPTR